MKQLSLVFAMVLMVASFAIAQRTITGTVTEDGGTPVIGANVLVKGTTSGTTTDIDGNYSISVPDGSTTLTFSYIGFASQDVELGASNIVNVTMSEGITLNNVVVTALGVERDEKAVGYAVQQVGGEDIQKANTPNVINALRGKAAGVNVVSASGAAGGGARIIVRGQTSLSGNNQALVVVDGVRINNSTFNSESTVAGVANSNRAMDVNPNDIETINVLKGAAATALYGVDGANGVIVITTKKGKAGKGFDVSVGSSVTFDRISQMPTLQSQYAQGWAGGYFGPETGWFGSWGPSFDTLYWDGDNSYEYDPNGRIVGAGDPNAGTKATPYDNISNFFQTGVSYDNNVAVSGGNDKANFRFSMSNFQQEGVVPNNTFERSTFKLNSGLKLTDKISVNVSGNYTKSGGNRIQQGSNTSGLLLGLLRTSPSFDNAGGVADPVNDPASYTLASGAQRNYRGGGGYDNPYWTVNNTPRTDEVNRFFGSLRFDYKMHQWANFSANIGTDAYSDRRKQEFEIGSRTAPSGRVFEDQYFFRNFDGYYNLTGRGNVTDDLQVGYLVGVNAYSESLNVLYTEGNTLSFPGFVHITNASDVQSDQDFFNQKNIGFFGNIDLSYKSFLYFTVTGRQDFVSSLIVPGSFNSSDISFFYPSANLGLVFTELMDNTSVLSFGKLRLSYAEVGGGAPSAYGTTTPFVVTSADDGWVDGVSFPFQGISGFTRSNALGNTNLIPERTGTFEGGLDLRFFNGKLNLDLTYYNSTSKDLILNVPISGSTGYTSALLNSGELSSQGLEVILKATPVQTADLTWDVQVNFDRNVTMVESLAEGVETQYLGGFIAYNIAGHPYGQIFGGAYLRDNAGDANDDGVSLPSGNIVINDDPTSGEYGYQIPDQSLRVIGNPNPDFTVGFNNTLTYKDLSLSFLLDWKQGGYMWNGTQWALTFFGMAEKTLTREDDIILDGVSQSDGSLNDITIKQDQSYWTSSVGGFGSVDEAFVQSTTWVRLRDISLSYNLSPELFSGSFIESGGITVSGRNLFLWTPYEGVDPETSLTGASNNGQGVDYFNMPGTKAVSIGVNLNF